MAVTTSAVNRWVGRLSVWTAAMAFLLLLGALLAGFVSREVLGRGLIGTDELARLSFVWCALFGASAAWSDDALHRIDLLTRQLQGLTARWCAWLRQAMISGVLLYLIYYGWLMMLRALDQTSSSLQISGIWIYLPLPIAATLMLVTSIGRWTACHKSTPQNRSNKADPAQPTRDSAG